MHPASGNNPYKEGVLNFRVYANRNYWTTTGWKDDAVPDFDESARGRVEGRTGDAGGRGESAGAAAAGFGETVFPEKNYLCDGAVCRFGRDAEGAHARVAGVVA